MAKKTGKTRKPINYSRTTILSRKKELTLLEFVEFSKLTSSYKASALRNYISVDYEYDSYYPCHHGSDCCNNDYCRCEELRNARVKGPLELLKFPEKLKLIDQYYFDRVIRLLGALKEDNWEVSVGSGYYGQEIDGISLYPMVENEIFNNLSLPDDISDADKLKKALEIEYGYILDILISMNKVRLLELPPKSLRLFNEHYYGKIDRTLYKDHALPACVVRKDVSGKYVVIDGYHRLAALMGKPKIKVYELYEK